jgi:hypothetical protein
MWSALELILFKDIFGRFGRVRPGIVGMNDELAAACLESGIENAPQNNVGREHVIELLALWKREHAVELRHSESYCDHDLSVLQNALRSSRGFFARPKIHIIIQIEQTEPGLVAGYHDVFRIISDQLEQFQQLAR